MFDLKGVAAIDWDAAITAQRAGELPCSGCEHRILELPASLAAGIPVSFRDTITGLYDNNVARLLVAIRPSIRQSTNAHRRIVK